MGTGSGYNRVDDLLPARLSSTPLALLEKFLLLVIVLLSAATVIFGIVQGVAAGHQEHIVMAIIVALCFPQFAMVLRLYSQDVLQDRKVVYYGGFTQFLIATVGLMYAANWAIVPPGPLLQALTQCDGRSTTTSTTCYTPKGTFSQCLNLGGSLEQNWLTTNKTCKVFSNTTANYGFSDLNTGFPGGSVSVTQAKSILTRCHLIADHTWANCSNGSTPRPPAPTPRNRERKQVTDANYPTPPTPRTENHESDLL